MGHSISNPSNSRRFPWVTLIAVGGGLLAVVFLLMFWRASATIHGEEFSPYSFRVRKFQYIPQLRTVSEIPTPACSAEITKHLTNSTTLTASEIWDVVEFQKGVFPSPAIGEASLLVGAIRDSSRRGESWEAWSKEKPKLAAILWPAVQQLAVHGAYFAIPDALEIAMAESTETGLKNQLDETSQEAAIDQCRRLLKKGDAQRAKKVAEWARTFGNSSEVLQLQSEMKTATLSAESHGSD